MANENAYVLGPDNIIQDNLKIFIGTFNEIKKIEDEKRVVNRKFYLAWDVGEIYLGNGVQKLIRFGGSANNLSEDDIKKIIQSYTKEDIRVLRSQMTDALRKYSETNSNFIELSDKINATIEELNTNTLAYIEEKVNEVLKNAEDLTYSKSQIEALIEQNYKKVSENFVSNDSLNITLSNYTTKTYVDSTKLSYSQGNTILSYLNKKQNGYYFCTSDSTDSDLTFERGHTYFLNNGSYEDLTAEGSGTVVTTPTITLQLNNETSKTLTVGDNFNTPNTLVSYSITNQKYMRGLLSFYENKNLIKSNISLTLNSFYFNPTLTNLKKGTYSYTLIGTDRNENTIIGTFNLNVMAPIYFGSGSNIIPSETVIKSLDKKLSNSVAGEYNISVKQNEYVWFFIPSDLTITNITLNGFTAPFNEPESTTLTFGSVTQDYKAYRSYESLQAGMIKLNVI